MIGIVKGLEALGTGVQGPFTSGPDSSIPPVHVRMRLLPSRVMLVKLFVALSLLGGTKTK